MDISRFSKGFVDWFTVFVCFVLVYLVDAFMPSNQRLFSIDDKKIMFPYTSPEKVLVPEFSLIFLSTILPLIVIVGFGAVKTNWEEISTACSAFLMSILNTVLLTNFIKKIVGRPRPDFLARCVPSEKTDSSTLYDKSICTQKDLSIITEGFKSFPSGHSSIIFAGQTFLFLYLSYKLSSLNTFRSFKFLILMVPILIASYVAASRSIDYWHHWQDIVAGSLIGLIFASYGFFVYFKDFDKDSSEFSSYTRANDNENEYNMFTGISVNN
ncbi:hypothetical protein BB560_002453 [Smittium megazygosporum]|uniref:Phosphatidic acid phosphatase type 2/haloperoxidase domain-containing protein n=1 Tax=Smittium megazygosporum TaxID=133381 RepID=A0A2T9ZEU3_9FUNG|nr:hypothetical protein BB560_002453 [Smittium megazygosporum]